MLRNLVAEMGRKQISENQVAKLLNKNYRWARKRIREEVMESGEVAQFGTLDLQKIKSAFFPECSMDYLAVSDFDFDSLGSNNESA